MTLVKFVLKSIYEARDGPDGQFWAISGPHVVREGPNSPQIIKIEFRYHLYKRIFALKCIPDAVLEVLLLLGVSQKATGPDHSNLGFWHLLTTPNTQKVVPFVGEFT